MFYHFTVAVDFFFFFIPSLATHLMQFFPLLSGMKPPQERQLILVANAHMHWDPEYSDVKLIQTMMFLSELKSIAERASGSVVTGSPTSDPSSIPIVLCADLNSLPDSGMAVSPFRNHCFTLTLSLLQVLIINSIVGYNCINVIQLY